MVYARKEYFKKQDLATQEANINQLVLSDPHYIAYCDDTNGRFLKHPLIPLLIIISTYINISYFKDHSMAVGLAYAPALALWLVHRLLTTSAGYEKVKSTFWNLIFGFFTMLGVTVVMTIGGEVTLLNSSHLQLLTAIAILVRPYRLKTGLIYFYLLMSTFFITFYLFHPSLIEKTMMQIIMSSAIGYFIMKVRFRELSKTFYDNKMQTQQAIQLSGELKKVVYPHQLDGILDGKNIEETLPVGISQACSLQLDVVGSGEIVHENFGEALRRVDNRCKEVLMKNYDPSRLIANGFRLKGTGDGFITTHGFPFRTPGSETSSSIALKCAIDFVKIFDEEMAKLEYASEILCSIGIAFGEIEGYFSKISDPNGEKGVIEYDMFGRAIELSTRYESFRKSIFKSGHSEHVILIPQKVFNNLKNEQRQLFEKYNLDEIGEKIRGDRSAKYVFVQRIASQQKDQSGLKLVA